MSSAPATSKPKLDDSRQVSTKGERLPFSRYVLFLLIAAGGLSADLITKQIIFNQYFTPREPMAMPEWWIDGVLGVQTSTNGGALFGIGQGGSHWFAMLSLIALGAVLYWLFVRRLAASRLLTVSLAMVSGGILGNFYDRIGLGYQPEWNMPAIKYHVRDWVHFRWEGVSFLDPWPNFNIADSLLVVGAGLLFIYALFGYSPAEETSTSKNP